ncbi:radical SAM protein [Aliarcobacter butzleri]|uniref:Radical SAM protein n=1 Tax=Aliarcobacter butzleri L351 TaxID=1447259 RepID=A0A837J7P9_9BACT|nr:radical SAM protein [Aliarcobacter butzleri]KLE02105.1 radical SAM protein [Aliarcobacter butzleri L351]KLE13702.1 radical SAM protein [Aliarcobacter butzleri L350]MDN5048384.1 radical SAM protein [Aliarcobacter butzleri]MDN5060071.1 radical SAM protein [Aliarcobacter butzleri]MDN5110568.1 radical SAM protein [Aliarcobacter butzleri]
MSYSNSIIFGPIPSRRFGISLGIDLSPSKKQCNFDCLYCELEGAKTVDKMDTFLSVDEIIKAIKESFKNHPKIDVITITCNGEPTLYPKLNKLIDEINKIKGETKILILSNGSTIYKKEIFEALLKIDIVKLSLDCISEKCFKKLDRQNKSVEIEKIVPSMIEFSQKTKKDFVLEILFVKNVNDNEEELDLLYEAIILINPKRIDIGTIDRPPAYKVNPVSYEFLEDVANKFEGLNVNIVFKNRPKQIISYNKEEILSMINRRPLTIEDIENMFDNQSKIFLEELIRNQEIGLVDNAGIKFFKKTAKI